MPFFRALKICLQTTLLPGSGLELKTFLSHMECLLSENLPDLDGPVLFMAPYRSQEEPKNEFLWSSKTPQVESGTLLLWPLIAILSIISHPGALTPEIGSKNLGASPPMAYKAWTKPSRSSGRCQNAELMYSSKSVCIGFTPKWAIGILNDQLNSYNDFD